MYNWQYKNWANFTYHQHCIDEYAWEFASLTGEVFGIFNAIENPHQQNELINLMIAEAKNTSAIEGENLQQEDLMSSIRNNLGLNKSIKKVKDKRAENIATLMIQVHKNYDDKLSEKLIKHWHQILFKDDNNITAGKYRKDKLPMQIISGAYGKEKIHYEAPPSEKLAEEMKRFVKWYNTFEVKNDIKKAIIKTAITHLYFESIHPFEDGNGRIGRALAEKCLAESLNRQLLLSISTSIDKNKKTYYSELNKASHTLKIDDWLIYFAQLLIEAQKNTIHTINISLKKKQFFESHSNTLNTRQSKVLKKMLDLGGDNFIGGMTAKKYISITKTTKATATRDLQELVKRNILLQKGAGRSTYYILNMGR